MNRNHNLDDGAAAATVPSAFVVTAVNPATQYGRGGFRVLQQRRTLQLAKLSVHKLVAADGGSGGSVVAESWAVTTSNVRRFRYTGSGSTGRPVKLLIDGAQAPLAVATTTVDLCGDAEGGEGGGRWEWSICAIGPTEFETHSGQRGPSASSPGAPPHQWPWQPCSTF